jgi:uncharacterized protein YjiK
MSFLRVKLTYIFIVILTATSISCNTQINFTSPPGYDLNHPVKIFLATELNEISGIIYYPKDTSIFGINDESGSLFKIFPDRNTLVQRWRFSSNHDYEDLQRVDSTFYVLSSNGDIVAITFSKTAPAQVTRFEIKDKEKNEFETLYFDSTLNKLILICKSCKQDKKNTVSTRAFNIASHTYSDGPYKINVSIIEKLMRLKNLEFKPSAAAINPLTHELFILSSVNKMLVVADANGNVKQSYPLRPSLYKQPEGIAFTPSGSLLISNESAKEGSANILVIKHQNRVK